MSSNYPPFLTPLSWHTSDWYINTKFSGYVSWGKRTSNLYTLLKKIRSQNFQDIFLEVKWYHQWHNGWPPRPAYLQWGNCILLQARTPHSWCTSNEDTIHKVQVIFKQDHPWHQGWPYPPSLLSGTIFVLQVPFLRKEGSWHTIN